MVAPTPSCVHVAVVYQVGIAPVDVGGVVQMSVAHTTPVADPTTPWDAANSEFVFG